MRDDRLSALISIENEISQSLDFDGVMNFLKKRNLIKTLGKILFYIT